MRSGSTIKDVAREAGCSPSLVSLFLRNPGTTRVAEETKKRISRSVEKLNYRRNMLASILKSGSSNVIGVLVDAQANPPVHRLIACLEREAAGRGCRLQLGLFHNSLDSLWESYSTLKQYGAGGVICLSHDYPEFNRELEERFAGIGDVVFFNGPERPGHSCVIPDLETGMEMAFRHLREHGRHRIGLCIPGNGPAWDGILRRISAFKFLSGDDSLICPIPREIPLRQAIEQTLFPFIERQHPDALLMSNDRIALCAAGVLKARGLNIPENMALVGFDNDPADVEAVPSLSSIAVDNQLAARKLFDLLASKKSGTETSRLRPELFIRESC